MTYGEHQDTWFFYHHLLWLFQHPRVLVKGRLWLPFQTPNRFWSESKLLSDLPESWVVSVIWIPTLNNATFLCLPLVSSLRHVPRPRSSLVRTWRQQERVTLKPVVDKEGRYYTLLCVSQTGWSLRVGLEPQVSKITPSQCICANWRTVQLESEIRKVFSSNMVHQVLVGGLDGV